MSIKTRAVGTRPFFAARRPGIEATYVLSAAKSLWIQYYVHTKIYYDVHINFLKIIKALQNESEFTIISLLVQYKKLLPQTQDLISKLDLY